MVGLYIWHPFVWWSPPSYFFLNVCTSINVFQYVITFTLYKSETNKEINIYLYFCNYFNCIIFTYL